MKCPLCGFDNIDGSRLCDECSYTLPVAGMEEKERQFVSSIFPGDSLQNSKYFIEKEIGRGGMGNVFLGRDEQEGRLCVIKQCSLEESENKGPSQDEMKTLFYNEASLLAKLNYPGIPKVWDYFEENGMLFLVEEWIEGESLEDMIGKKKFEEIEIINIAIKLCDILEYIHSFDPMIIHRDIKPSNILITTKGDIYLIDFGIARIFKAGKTKDTICLGTEEYSPPEQWTEQTDNRSDIYSLGATLWALLAGRAPILSNKGLLNLSKFNKNLSPEMETIIQKAVAVNRNDRYQRAADLKQDLLGLKEKLKKTLKQEASPHIEEWKQFKGSPHRTGYSNANIKNDKIRLSWQCDLGESIYASPLLNQDCALIITESGNLYCIDVSNGKIRNREQLGYNIRSTPAIVGSFLYLATFDKSFIVYDLTKSTIVESLFTGIKCSNGLLHFSNMLIFSGNYEIGGKIMAVDLQGRIKWQRELYGKCGSSPTFGEGKVFIGDASGAFVSLDFRTGNEIWKNQARKKISNTSLFVNERIFVGTNEGIYYCLSPQNGRVLWESQIGFEIVGSPSWSSGIIVLTTNKGGVFALLEDSGRVIWSRPEPAVSISPPLSLRQQVIMSDFSQEGYIYCLDITNGEIIWGYKGGGGFIASPLPISERVIFTTMQGKVLCLGH